MNLNKAYLVLGLIAVLLFFGAVALLWVNHSPAETNLIVPSLGGGFSSSEVQEVELKALSTGSYDKQTLTVKAGIPVKLTFSAEKNAGCGRQLVIPDFGVNLVVNAGEFKTVEFTPVKTGEYAYRCGMNMFRGVLRVV
ncbi:MAG: cupredoxin domain-containing protein [Candidatus Micrarchaeota archaeon]